MPSFPLPALRSLAIAAFSCLVVPTGSVWADPTVFPTGVTVLEEGTTPGYLVFRSFDGRMRMLDIDGTYVHTWAFPCSAGAVFKLLDDGHILGKACEAITELDWGGNVVWEFAPPEGVTLHHDWERLPNGNTLTLARHTIEDPDFSSKPVDTDFIMEISPRGEIVWEWHLIDHWQELDLAEARVDRIRENGGDWSHANTLAPIPEDSPHNDPRFRPGNLIVSLRHQNAIFIVDPVTGEIVWKMTDRTIGQHQTYMIPADYPGGGNILVFDNGWAGEWSIVSNRFRSRVVEIDPTNKTVPFVYHDEDSGSPVGSLFSWAISGAQRLPNGNTVITDGRWGRAFEITPDKQLVWEFINPFIGSLGGNKFYRTIKVPYGWAGPQFETDLTLSANAMSVDASGGVRYAVVVENRGADPAIGVELAWQPTADAWLDSYEAPDGWRCIASSARGQAVRCETMKLPPGASASITLDVRYCRGGRGPVVSSFALSSTGQDTNPDDNASVLATEVLGNGCPRAPFCGDAEVNLPGETCDPPGSAIGAAGQTCRDDCTACGDGEVNGAVGSVELLVDGDLESWSNGALVHWRLTTEGGSASQITTEPASGSSALRLDREVPESLLRAFQDIRGLTPGEPYTLRFLARADGSGTNGRIPVVKVTNVTRQEWLDETGAWRPETTSVIEGELPTPNRWDEFRVDFETPASHGANDVYRVVLQQRGTTPVRYDGVSLTGQLSEECDDGNAVDDDACSNQCTLNDGD